jgi:excinuclease UvrABC ATPase subunit
VRNPQNEPTKKQEQVLKEFERLWNKTKENVPTQRYTNEEGQTVWMKAIVMQPQCAACHGSSIEPELRKVITDKYPNDKATGFEVGKIRGAFLVRAKN